VNAIDEYLAGVRAALSDLPSHVVDELLEDLPDHLAEVTSEEDGSLVERLGPPAAYAAELRAAAGLEAPAAKRGNPRLVAAYARLRSVSGVVDRRVGRLMGYDRASEFARLLRPAWWIVRGWVVALLLGLLFVGDHGLRPTNSSGSGKVLGILLLVACVLGSIWLGRRTPGLGRRARRVVAVTSAFLGVAALAFAVSIDDQLTSWHQQRYQESVSVAVPPPDDPYPWRFLDEVAGKGVIEKGYDEYGRAIIIVHDGSCYRVDQSTMMHVPCDMVRLVPKPSPSSSRTSPSPSPSPASPSPSPSNPPSASPSPSPTG